MGQKKLKQNDKSSRDCFPDTFHSIKASHSQHSIHFSTSQENQTVKQRKPARNTPSPIFWVALAALVLLAGFYVLAGNSTKPQNNQTSMLPPGEPIDMAPGFTLADLSGKSVSLSDFKGKVVILDFWATWCPPCKKEIPDFIELQKQYGSQGVQIVGIALDQPDKVKAFVQQNGINYPVLLGNDAITVKYGGIDGIPTTFVIDKKGKIINRFEGFRPKSVFEGEIKKLL
jgi:peroxiredoxin